MPDIEKLGQFYLGRLHDLQTGITSADEPILYDARDLTTHAVCVGMTGSGKTGLCLSLLEEAAIDGIPAICIDPKGDLGNLMLTFPDLLPENFQPWIDPSEAIRQGQTVPELATKTAALWKKGLADWGQDGRRIQRFRDAAEVAIYTPASTAGRPLTVLKSFAAPGPEVQPGTEAYRERMLATVSGLLALMQIDADPISSREHILLSTILDSHWRTGTSVDMATLIRSIQSPTFTRVGFLDLESFFPTSDRFKLAMSLNNLLASPGFAAWLDGEPLNIGNLLYTPEGKPRLAIISIAHLSDAERMFFLTILLNEVLTWIRTQPGTTSLRALLYMDEVFGYFPPTANPPSKKPMLTLLKQARAFGLGVVLATQNPVDLDYKGLSNCGTWLLGRLQTERDKMRVMEGLEGAAASVGGRFDRVRMERTLAGLGSRVFLMNNVHEDGPVVFQSRWALSFLRGPVTRQQIETLMAPLKSVDRTSGPASQFAAPSAELAQDGTRPVLPPKISELFFPVSRSADSVVFRPALLGQARVHYVDSSTVVDQWDEVTLLRLAGDDVPDDPWPDADEWDESQLPELTSEPDTPNAVFRELPPQLILAKSYSVWEKSLKSYLFREQKLVLSSCPALSEASKPGESESDFRIRLRHAAREQRDLQIEKLRQRFASRLNTLENKIRTAEQRIERERSEKNRKRLSAAVSIGGTILGAIFGRKATSSASVSRAGSAIKNASELAGDSEQIRHAEENYSATIQQRDDLNAEVETEVQKIQDQFDPDLMQIDKLEIVPRKADMSVTRVILVWLPYSQTRTGETERAF